MNFVLFGIILICCHAWAFKIDDIEIKDIEINDNFLGEALASKKTKLENFLESFKSTLRSGDSSLGLPVLDPFTAASMPIKFDKKDNIVNINLLANLTNVEATGLSSYNVNSADFKVFGLKAHADLTWPLITASTNYSTNSQIFNHALYGNGGVNAAVHNFRFQINISFVPKGKHIQVKSLSTTISLGALDFKATGIYNDDETSEVLSKTISDTAPELIKQYQNQITQEIQQILTQIINKYLSTITLKELLKMLGL
ncbi:hypothetical protein PUN28_003872 [Cardiocondyla obscurior]